MNVYLDHQAAVTIGPARAYHLPAEPEWRSFDPARPEEWPGKGVRVVVRVDGSPIGGEYVEVPAMRLSAEGYPLGMWVLGGGEGAELVQQVLECRANFDAWWAPAITIPWGRGVASVAWYARPPRKRLRSPGAVERSPLADAPLFERYGTPERYADVIGQVLGFGPGWVALRLTEAAVLRDPQSSVGRKVRPAGFVIRLSTEV